MKRNPTTEHTDRLLARYFAGESSADEERGLRAAAEAGEIDDIPTTAMLRGLGVLAGERMPERTVRRRRVLAVRWQAWAAAAAIAVGCFVAVRGFDRPYCYIDGVPIRDAETAMQATAYLAPLERFDDAVGMLDAIIETDKNI